MSHVNKSISGFKRYMAFKNVHKNSNYIADKHGQFGCSCRALSIWGVSKATEWTKAVSDAEKIVGYPTSFMSLRLLLSDEISNVAMNMRKLVGSKHPLLKTARQFVSDEKHSMQTRGLIVLLMAKAAGPATTDDITEQMVSGIYPSQRTLAEITEMIHTACLIHKGIVNLDELRVNDNSSKDMEFGNKMAVLTGDYLLANACTGLAELHNTKVVEVVASAISDMMSAEFTELKDKNAQPVLPQGTTMADWQKQTYLATGSLIAKSCQSALELSHQSKELQSQAFVYGEHMAYARQLHEDLDPFLHCKDNGDQFSITSAPVIMFMSHDDNSHMFDELVEDQSSVACKKLYRVVKNSKSVEETKQLCYEHGQKALNSLVGFPESEARTALSNIVQAITKF